MGPTPRGGPGGLRGGGVWASGAPGGGGLRALLLGGGLRVRPIGIVT